jgi:hypothetical protein
MSFDSGTCRAALINNIRTGTAILFRRKYQVITAKHVFYVKARTSVKHKSFFDAKETGHGVRKWNRQVGNLS